MARRLAAPIFLFFAVLSVPSEPASAHAGVVSSEPNAGSELSTAPGVVTITFTEPLNRDLSHARVTAPDGAVFDGVVSGPAQIRVPLSTNQPGVYVVEWTTVSVLDGHALRGSFGFGVGVAPGEVGAVSTSTSPQASDVVVSGFRAVEYAMLLLAVGMLVVRRLARRDPELTWVRTRLRPVLAVALVAGIAVVVGEAVRAAGWSTRGLASYLTTGLPGFARASRLGAEVAALALAGVGLVVAPLVAALVALAAAGHAAAVQPRWLGIGTDVLHLIAAGIWAGGMLVLATVRPPGGWRGPEGRALLARFSPVAIVAFAVATGAGIARGFQELSSPSDLVRTSYGVALLVKVLAVLVMIQLSVLVWRRIVGSPCLEAGVAVGVVALAALLAAYPLPPARLAEAEEAVELARAARLSALPRPGDLTLGGDAGQVLVGLTIRPAEPGPNEALVYLLPLEGEEAAVGLSATIIVAGRMRAMTDCGPTCRRAEVELAGGEQVSVTVGGPTGGTASFELPAFPADGGKALLRRVRASMLGLTSYRLDESLSSGLETVVAHYAFEAPDLARFSVEGDGTNVFIGGTRFVRGSEDAPWKVIRGAPPLRVPTFVWDGFSPYAGVHRLGEVVVDGIRTRVLAFFGMSGSVPAWFRMWVAPSGLVLRAQMRAQGHFMDHRYFDFDSPVNISAPDVEGTG